MALILPNTALIHFHKTGGMWVREVVRRAGISEYESGHKDLPGVEKTHQTYEDAKIWIGTRIAFGFIRHPMSWMKSYWAYRMKWDNWTDSGIDNVPGRDNLEQWIEESQRQYPGFLSMDYVKWYKGCKVLGRTEDLRQDFLTIMGRFERKAYRRLHEMAGDVPYQNTTDSAGLEISTYLQQIVLVNEAASVRMWSSLKV